MLILLLYALLCTTVHSVQVDTVYGTVEGRTIELIDEWHAGISVNTFYSIPFARPPLGDLRFAPPEEPDPWDDVFDADYLGTQCEQSDLSLMMLTHPTWRDYGEDCLHLHIFTPTDMSGAPYPTMVYMFGGGNIQGGNIQYPGHFLAAEGVVVVVPNYRLSTFGFAFSGDGVLPGNVGLMDQTLALHFVQDNILAFGGDPDMVTIFGESAGAQDSGLHMMTPYSAGLFHRAMLQSGQELSTRSSDENIRQVAENADCPTQDTEEMAECLRERSAEEIRNATLSCGDEYSSSCGQGPKIDGDYLPDTAGNLRERGEFNIVPEVIGYNRDDTSLLFIPMGPPVWRNGLNRTEFQEWIRFQVEKSSEVIDDEDREEDIYQALDFYYTPWPHIHDPHKNLKQLSELYTDQQFFKADMQAKMHADYAPVHYYIFDYMPAGTIIPESFGTPHIMELPYMWGMPFIRHNPEVRNQTEMHDWLRYTEDDDIYADFMVKLWTNYGKYGDPTPDPIDPPSGPGNFKWTEFSHDNYDYIYMGKINDTVEMRTEFRQHEYAFWREYLQWQVYGDDGWGIPPNIPELWLTEDDIDCVRYDPDCLLDWFDATGIW